jgi:VanZ family protein
VLWSLASGISEKKKVYQLMAVSITFGVLIEILQATMSLGRSYELDDIIANTIGSVLGLVMLPFIRQNIPLLKKYLPFLNKVH